MKDREKKESQLVMNTKVSHCRSREPIIPIAQETQWPGRIYLKPHLEVTGTSPSEDTVSKV